MLLEMQDNKINSLMNEVKKMKDGKGGIVGAAGSGSMNSKAYFINFSSLCAQIWSFVVSFDREKDLENLMMLNAFDDTLANTRLYYGDQSYNTQGRNARVG